MVRAAAFNFGWHVAFAHQIVIPTPPAVMAVPIAVVAITGVNSDAVTVMTVAMRRGRAPFHNDVKS